MVITPAMSLLVEGGQNSAYRFATTKHDKCRVLCLNVKCMRLCRVQNKDFDDSFYTPLAFGEWGVLVRKKPYSKPQWERTHFGLLAGLQIWMRCDALEEKRTGGASPFA